MNGSNKWMNEFIHIVFHLSFFCLRFYFYFDRAIKCQKFDIYEVETLCIITRLKFLLFFMIIKFNFIYVVFSTFVRLWKKKKALNLLHNWLNWFTWNRRLSRSDMHSTRRGAIIWIWILEIMNENGWNSLRILLWHYRINVNFAWVISRFIDKNWLPCFFSLLFRWETKFNLLPNFPSMKLFHINVYTLLIILICYRIFPSAMKFFRRSMGERKKRLYIYMYLYSTMKILNTTNKHIHTKKKYIDDVITLFSSFIHSFIQFHSFIQYFFFFLFFGV